MKNILIQLVKAIAAFGNSSNITLLRSNRILHTLGCFIGSALLGWQFGVGAGIAAEAKDVQAGRQWDWLDIAADAIGTALGAIAHYLIFKP